MNIIYKPDPTTAMILPARVSSRSADPAAPPISVVNKNGEHLAPVGVRFGGRYRPAAHGIAHYAFHELDR